MIVGRSLTISRRAPNELLGPFGAAVREALRAPRRVWIFNGVLALLCAGVWTVGIAGFDRPMFPTGPHLPWWWLAVAFYLAEVLVVHLQFRKQAHTLSLTEIGLTLGLLLSAPSAVLFGQVVGTVVALVLNRRRSQLRQLAKFGFNLAELPLCSGIALVVFRSLASPSDSAPHLWVLVLVACGIAHVVGILLVSTVIAIAEERLQAPQLGRTLVTSLLGALATACLGLAVVELLQVRPLAVLLLVVPVLATVVAFRGYMEQREQREHLEFLYESMRATQGAPEFGLAVGQLLVAARRMLRAEYAEILLLPPADGEGPLKSVSGAEGELLMHPEERFAPEDAAAFAEVESIGSATLLTRRRARPAFDAFLRSRGLEDAIVGPLRGEDRTFGLLVVGERLGDVSTFAEADVELMGTFAGHASILLENGRLEHSLAEVTQLKEQLRHQAYHDALTGLPNRLNLVEAVEQELKGGSSTAVLYLDLDRFKTVNDTWGHSAGDALLSEFSRRLEGAIRTQDLAARLGGDEFAVLVRDADAETAVGVARRVLDAIDGTYVLECGDVACHVSVGIAVGAGGITTGEDVIRNADIAMYSVKRSERAYTLYEADLHEKLRAQRQLGLDLEAAIERREILVHFQPVVRLANEEIEGFEVLARWPHPTRGLLTAADFLPAAEEAGLTIELGRLVLQQALEAARRWPSQLTIWLNLAAAELANERLVDTLAEALKGYGVEPSRLVIEVTESGVIQGSDGALVAMRRLRELGVGLSIDDFGTGYSSLSRLAEFPIESLKIPKPFVDRLVGEDADEAFVDAILRLGDSLGLAAVAEGIEHRAQAQRLRQMGCRYGQGYFFGRPAPAEEVERVLYAELVARPPLSLVASAPS
ncbi:MAG TPA: EAL domain-containing protein [Gaiellaceae bacterium]|nr:EAL domain-containing protein [Gaiellaceae bacterium]